MPAAHSPDSQRHAGARKEEGTQQRSASQPADLLCSPGKRALFPGAAPQTSDLPPGSGSPPGAWALQRNTSFFTSSLSVYKQLSSAGPDPPKGSGAGIVPVPGRCWEIQLGAGCSCSWSVTQSAGKGLNSIPGLTTHLL